MIDHGHGVRRVAVHEAAGDRAAAVRVEDHHLVERLGRKAPVVPAAPVGLEVAARLALLRVDEVGELERVADEEHWGVVADHVPVAFLGVELDCKAARIAGGVGRAGLPTDGGEADEDGGFLANLVEKVSVGVLCDVLGHLEHALGAVAFGVHDALGHALAVEALHLLLEPGVISGDSAVLPDCAGVVVVLDRAAEGGGEDRALLQVGCHGGKALVAGRSFGRLCATARFTPFSLWSARAVLRCRSLPLGAVD
mmetsp:Transcript_10322/g.32898  ORF Transcript_10322/g.32898 Transcript_10322/m.32898 type:complete len:253 (+) Transcript_10322:594-1352(+)